jgi:hypothetical protein
MAMRIFFTEAFSTNGFLLFLDVYLAYGRVISVIMALGCAVCDIAHSST